MTGNIGDRKNKRKNRGGREKRKENRGENEELSEVFKIFANTDRLAILRFLKAKGERPVGDIADNIKASFGVTSKYLLYLAKKGILRRCYDSPFVLYSLANNISVPARLILSNIVLPKP